MFPTRLRHHTGRLRAAGTACTTAVIATALVVASASAGVAATKTTAKTPAKPAKSSTKTAANPVSAVSAKGPTKTTLPAPVTPSKDLQGWEALGDREWPKSLDAVRAKSINSSIRVHRAPDDFSPALQMTSGKSAFGAIAFLALGKKDEWVRVLLPLRPNGSVGWVRSSEVTLDKMTYRIIIEVDTNTLTVDGPDGNIVTTKVALGTNNTPTPTGLFYVREIVPQSNPNGGLGPIALGLSGLSEELRTFAGGYGRVAIHGTNAPGKIGADVSHGCVRMDNANITKLAKLLPLGTPVEIVGSRKNLLIDGARQSSDWIAVARPVVVEPSSVLVESDATTTTAPSAGAAGNQTTTSAVQAGSTVPPTSAPTSTLTSTPTSTIGG